MGRIVVSLTLAPDTKIKLFFTLCTGKSRSFNRILITTIAFIALMYLRIIQMRYNYCWGTHFQRLSHLIFKFLLDHSLNLRFDCITHRQLLLSFLLNVLRLVSFFNRCWLNPTLDNFELLAIIQVLVRNLLSLFKTQTWLEMLLKLVLFLVTGLFLAVDQFLCLSSLHLLLGWSLCWARKLLNSDLQIGPILHRIDSFRKIFLIRNGDLLVVLINVHVLKIK